MRSIFSLVFVISGEYHLDILQKNGNRDLLNYSITEKVFLFFCYRLEPGILHHLSHNKALSFCYRYRVVLSVIASI